MTGSEILAAIDRALKTVGEQIREQDERAEILAEVERVWQARKQGLTLSPGPSAAFGLHEENVSSADLSKPASI